MSELRRALPLPAIPLLLAVAGCSLLPAPFSSPGTGPDGAGAATAAEIRDHQVAWQRSGVTSYTWRIAYACECLGGPLAVTVVNGAIAKAVDDRGAAVVDRAFPLTVDALFAQALRTIDGGGTVRVDWGGPSGLPRTMSLDPMPNAVDDELSVTVGMFASG